MATSYNGWPASPNASSIGIDPNWEPIPGHKLPGGIKRGDVETVMTWLALALHHQVEPIDRDATKDDWGYSYRQNRNNPATLSCHASGTAFDWNATRHPNGHRGTFSAAQVAKIHDLCTRQLSGAVRWGGDFHGTPDEMHFEVCVGPAQLAAVAGRLGGQTPQSEEDDMPLSAEDRDWLTAKINDAVNNLAVGTKKNIDAARDAILAEVRADSKQG